MSEYVVSFKTCMQVSPDDWDTITPSLKVTDSTTIKEIRDWYLSKNRGATSVGNLNIVELDKTAPPVNEGR